MKPKLKYVILAALLGFSACNDKSSNASEKSKPETKAKTYTSSSESSVPKKKRVDSKQKFLTKEKLVSSLAEVLDKESSLGLKKINFIRSGKAFEIMHYYENSGYPKKGRTYTSIVDIKNISSIDIDIVQSGTYYLDVKGKNIEKWSYSPYDGDKSKTDNINGATF